MPALLITNRKSFKGELNYCTMDKMIKEKDEEFDAYNDKDKDNDEDYNDDVKDDEDSDKEDSDDEDEDEGDEE